MNFEKLKGILETYGSRVDSWPSEEREAISSFLKNEATSDSAAALLAREGSLDSLLDEITFDIPNPESLSQNILKKVRSGKPESEKIDITDKILEWVLPRESFSIWQPALAAVLPILVGILFGIQMQNLNLEEEWDQEFYLNAFSTTSVDAVDVIEEKENVIVESKEVKHG